MLGQAVTAVVFYCFIIGFLIMPSKERTLGISEFLLESVAHSLFISWVVVALCYFFNLPNLLYVLILLTIARLWFYPIRYNLKLDYKVMIWFISLIATILFLYNGKYTLTFLSWDAVVSWNRWAEELFNNDLHTIGIVYPVFFPGFWSLIYKAMGTADYEIMAKLTLFIIPILLILSHISIYKISKVLGVMCSVFVVLFFFQALNKPLLNGYMDAPVSAFIFSSLIVLVYYSFMEANDEHSEFVLRTVAFIAGIGGIVKQAGMLVVVLILVYLFYLYLRKQINLRKFVSFGALVITPFLLFILMYSKFSSNYFGNFHVLRNLTESKATEGIYLHSYNQIIEFLGYALFIPLVALSIVNIYFIKNRSGFLGFLCLVFSILGFIGYANCCSYEFRNGWWLIVLLAISAMTSVQLLFTKFKLEL